MEKVVRDTRHTHTHTHRQIDRQTRARTHTHTHTHTQLQLGIKTADLAAAFDRIDVSGDMELELAEFIAAFKPSGVTYPYDLEDAVLQVHDVCLCV